MALESENIFYLTQKKTECERNCCSSRYLSSEDIYTKNGSPLELEIKAGDRIWTKRLESYVPNFSAPMDSMIYIDFGQSISVDSCIVTIKDSRSGTKYDDICIAEMFLYGE